MVGEWAVVIGYWGLVIGEWVIGAGLSTDGYAVVSQ